MPYTKLSQGTGTRIDWPVAAILWAKATQGLSWEDIAERVGVNPHTLRNWCFHKSSSEWKLYTLKKTLKELNLDYRELLSMEDK